MPVLFSLAFGSLLLLLILFKYVHARRAFISWNVRYGLSLGETQEATGTANFNGAGLLEPRRGIYDKWLVVRFTIAFIMLGYVVLLTC